MRNTASPTARLRTAAAVAIAGACHAATADASLTLDLRAVSGSSGVSVFDDLGTGKHASISTPGDVITLQVWARISGTDGLNNESLQLACANIASSIGGLLGNIGHSVLPPFNGPGSQNGMQQDFDSDGDLDVGSPGTAASGKIAYRSSAFTPMTNVIDGFNSEILVGQATFTALNFSSTVIQIIPRGGTTNGVASWREDGQVTSKNPGTGIFGVESPGVLVQGTDTYYWDTNGTTPGAGSAPSGTWGSGNFWTSDPNGALGTSFNPGQGACFSAGTDATGTYTVTVSGTQSPGIISFEEGNVTLTGGQLGAYCIFVRSPAEATIQSVISFGGGLRKTGTGRLTLTGANSYTGGTTLDGGTLSVSADNNLGAAAGGITFTGGTLQTTATFSNARPIVLTSIGGKIDVATGASLTLQGAVSGTSRLTKTGDGTLALGGNNTHTGPTLVAAGLLIYNSSSTRGARLDVADGATAQIAQSLVTPNNLVIRTGVVKTNSTGKLDLTDNKLIVTAPGSLGSLNGSAYTGITGLVAQGRNGGSWNGFGITTSMTDATAGSGYTSLGVALASEARGIGASQTDTWAGQTITGSDTLVMYTYGGDANLSGNVDVDDYGQIDFNAAVGGTLTGWFNGDFDYNGVVDVDDYGIIDFVVNIQGPPFPTGSGLGITVSTTPEPAAALLVFVPLLLRRQRRS